MSYDEQESRDNAAACRQIEHDMASRSPRDDDMSLPLLAGHGCGLCSGCAHDVPGATELPLPRHIRGIDETVAALAGLKSRYKKAGKLTEAKAVARAIEVLKE